MYIERAITDKLKKALIPGRAVILYGARRVGKTTLINHLKEELGDHLLFLNAENSIQREALMTENVHELESLLSQYRYLMIDEAQKIPQIGQILKLIVDHFPQLSVLATGSASFELASQVGEPLTGRKRTFVLFPIAISELYANNPLLIAEQQNERLIYGSYPKVLTDPDLSEKQEELYELVDSYLYKDILALENIKNSSKIRALLVLLAFQVGSKISLSEIGKQLNLHVTTVARYLYLLEKVFVIFRLQGFSRNLRKEVTKSCKYYFYDNGVRNALINNFNPMHLRDDQGKLWENFLMIERMKLLSNNREMVNRYFWRTYDQKEIDLIEETGGHLFAYEFKYGNGKVKTPETFLSAYPQSSFKAIFQKNYLDFLLKGYV